MSSGETDCTPSGPAASNRAPRSLRMTTTSSTDSTSSGKPARPSASALDVKTRRAAASFAMKATSFGCSFALTVTAHRPAAQHPNSNSKNSGVFFRADQDRSPASRPSVPRSAPAMLAARPHRSAYESASPAPLTALDSGALRPTWNRTLARFTREPSCAPRQAVRSGRRPSRSIIALRISNFCALPVAVSGNCSTMRT